jgi:hypothetical protein
MFKAQVEYAPYFYLQIKVGVGWLVGKCMVRVHLARPLEACRPPPPAPDKPPCFTNHLH